MTTRDKGITYPVAASNNISGVGLKTSSGGDYTVASSWGYNPAGSAPINNAPLTAIAPIDFTIRGQDASSGFAAPGGNIILRAGAGSVTNASGNVEFLDTNGGGGLWNQTHLILGNVHFWIDTANRLRVKSSAPTSATDGNVVGFDLSGSVTYDPPSLVDGAGTTTTVTVATAALGDFALVSFSNDLAGMTVTAYVSAANTVSVRFQNESGGTLDLASGTLRVRVVKQ